VTWRDGILYVATRQDRYVEAAFLSAQSVRQLYPDLPIALFTDRPGHPLCRASHFSVIETVLPAAGIASSWAGGQLDRLRCLTRTPFDRTLHIDSDTRVLTRELPALFDRLAAADVAMVETAIDDSYSRAQFGRRMFNAGLLLYRRSDRVTAFLSAWIALSARNFAAAGEASLPAFALLDHVRDVDIRRKLLFMDQLSLVEILSPEVNAFDLGLVVLDHAWNHRGSRLPENNRGAVRIWHDPSLRERTMQDLAALAESWTDDDAGWLRDYVAKAK
jgi:hypothetical protein